MAAESNPGGGDTGRPIALRLRAANELFMVLAWAFPVTGGAGERETGLFEESFDAKPGDGWAWVREDPAAWKIEKIGP